MRDERTDVIEEILASGADRGIKHERQWKVDRLPEWCKHMQQNGTARCAWMPKINATCAASSECRDAETLDWRTGERSPLAGYWLKRREAVDGTYVDLATSTSFFAAVKQEWPLLLCVNDDWPIERDAYMRATASFRDFLLTTYTAKQDWEQEHVTVWGRGRWAGC